MRALLFLLTLLLPFGVAAQQTAYQALRIAARGRSVDFSTRLLGAEGLHGSTQPKVWRFVFADPAARNGLRELEVANGSVVAERTPVRNPYSGLPPIAMSKLQVDSDSAFTAAENEARRRKLGFYAVNFLLQTGADSEHPVWRIELLDKQERVIGDMFIDGHNGLLVGLTGDIGAAANPESVSTELKIHRTLKKTGQSIADGVKHIGGSVQEIFTGERTIDKNNGPD